MYVCMHACMFVCMYVCVCMYLFTLDSYKICMHACMHVCMCPRSIARAGGSWEGAGRESNIVHVHNQILFNAC